MNPQKWVSGQKVNIGVWISPQPFRKNRKMVGKKKAIICILRKLFEAASFGHGRV